MISFTPSRRGTPDPGASGLASLVLVLFAVAACGDDSTPPAGETKGPPGEMLDVDLRQIPDVVPGSAGSAGKGGSPSKGGSGGSGGAKTYACKGTPYPCAGYGSAECSTVGGCYVTGDCGGISASCYSQFSSYSCGSLEGCYWSSSTGKCSGSSWGCSLFSGQSSCVYQSGCHWTKNCSGSPTPCLLLLDEECSSHPGCFLEAQ